MQPNQQIIRPDEQPLINLPPSYMPMPNCVAKIVLDDQGSLWHLLQTIREGKYPYLFAVMSDPRVKEAPDKYFKVGMIVETLAHKKDPIIFLKGLFRAERLSIKKIEVKDGEWFWVVRSKKVEDENNDEYFIHSGQNVMAEMIKIRDLLAGFIARAGEDYNYDRELMESVVGDFDDIDWDDKDTIDNFIWAAVVSVPDLFQKDKQPFLESTSLPERIELCVTTLQKRLRLLGFQKRAMDKDEKHQRRARNVLVQDEKDGDRDEKDGDRDDDFGNNLPPELAERRARYKKIKDTLGSDAQKAIRGDFARLRGSQSGQSDWNTFINHLDCLLDLYSTVEAPQESDVSKVEKILDESHYGLEDVKEEIYNHLAVKNLNPKGKAPILCFVGPSGVGKTSIGKSIAESLGLKFVRLSLGGVRDEAEIRGHRRTYIGAIPGKIIQEIIKIGVKNFVFMLDEVDKLGNDFRGDPSSALLEVLDPEQNYSFQDHYVGAPYDLSGVLFLCTANTVSGIQPALLDRMNVINVSGYTEFQKIQIAKKFLIPKQFSEVGLTDKGVKPCWPDNNPDKIISGIISGYTREAGVRELERQIHKILSVWARQYLKEDDAKKPSEILITEDVVEKLLGLPKQTHERANITEVGEAIGLAWTPVGGDILYIQAALMPFTGKMLSLTGSQGKVMIEACKVAMSRLRIYLEKAGKTPLVKGKTVHIHIPQGAVPKDGPSAGITTFCALYSEAFNLKVKPFVTMTGELTLKGRVTRVGGIKEKILAAHRDGLREVILPESNKRDLEKDIPEEIKKDLKFHFVTYDEEILPIVFPEK